MDDLDHSMHIADYDWTSFFEETEECCVLQPLLACPDNSNLSDSEDSEKVGSVFNTSQQKYQHSHACDAAWNDAAGCSMEDESCSWSIQLRQRSTREQDDLTGKAGEDGVTQEDSEKCDNYGENTLNIVTKALQAELVTIQCSADVSAEPQKETESDTCTLKSKQEPDPFFCNHTDQNVHESHTAERVESEDVNNPGVRAEKERWFVTVNDSPARQRTCTNVKKKRPKKRCKDSHMSSPGGEICFGNGINKENNDSEGVTDMELSSGEHLGLEIHPESFQTDLISDLYVVTFLAEKNEQKQVACHSQGENTNEAIDKVPHKAEPKNDTYTLRDTPLSGSVESDEFEDGAEFFSRPSYDSENYLSASESVEEHPFMENQQCLTDNTDKTQDSGMAFLDSTFFCNIATISCHENTGDQAHVEQTQNFPSALHRVNKMPDDNSTCDNTHSTVLCMLSNTPEHQVPTGFNLSASGCSIGDQLGSLPLPAPELTVTPCSVMDSPETYAETMGNTRPVYAISAFWDEMEKLTINDILQLKMGKSMPPREAYATQETLSPNANAADASPHSSSTVDTVDYNMADCVVMDTSDTTDSDYFTQLDESKPHCSSCEFSMSDFEEEYWQYLNASRNPSPDHLSKSCQSTTDSLFLEEEGSASSGEKETHVPLDDPMGQFFEWGQDSDVFSLKDLLGSRQIMKTKSMYNVQVLNTNNIVEGLSLQSCQSLDENTAVKMGDSLKIVTPALVLPQTDILDEHYQISFPEVVEYFFTDNKAKYDAMSVTVYDPEDISVVPLYDYTLSTLDRELLFTSLCDSQYADQKPTPIFSCSHPTVREVTFPKPDVLLAANCVEVDDVSPIRVVSHCFIQGFDCKMSAAERVESHNWKNLLSIRKIRFHDKGSIWCHSSGAWVFPAENKRTVKGDPPITVLSEGAISSAPTLLLRDLTAQQSIWEAVQTSAKQHGICSTIKQSDMCLVCIAFASWVLRSSDPEAADAWKAALLANVSALSAIQYLRHYVKKSPPQDHP